MNFKLLGNAAVDTDAEIYSGGGASVDPDTITLTGGLLLMIGILVAIHLGVGKRHSI